MNWRTWAPALSGILLATACAPALDIGSEAPELSVDKWLNAPSGASIRMSELRGSVVLIDAWATW